MDDNQACENTDRELWRGPDEGCGAYYADSIFITKEGALGINCGGSVHIRPVREWHRLAGGPIVMKPRPTVAELEAILNSEGDNAIEIRPDGSIRTLVGERT